MSRMDDVLRLAEANYGARSKAAYTGEDCLYSTVAIAPGTLFPVNFSFFTQGINSGTGLTYAQTNLDDGGRLSNNDQFLVMDVGFQWFQTACNADLNFLCNGTWLDWQFYNNRFFFGKPEMFPGGSVAYGTAAANLGTLVAVANLGPQTSTINGMPSKHNHFALGEPGILLRDNDSFKMVLSNAAAPYTTATVANGGTGLTMTAWLRGYRIRSVR